MSNTALYTASMHGLWSEEAFRGFFTHGANASEEWACIMKRLKKERRVMLNVSGECFIQNLLKYVPETRLRAFFPSAYLDGSARYPQMDCILSLDERDSITTIAPYSPDSRIGQALSAIFPEKEVKCSWFIDGLGEQGSYTLLGSLSRDKSDENVNEMLSCKNRDDYGCDICSKRIPFNDVIWLTACVGLCSECREKMSQEDCNCIMEHEDNSEIIDRVLYKYLPLVFKYPPDPQS